MSESTFITRHEFHAFMKDVHYLADQARAAMSARKPAAWITQREAMELLRCKRTTLTKMRVAGLIDWRYKGQGSRNVLINRKSCDDYMNSRSTL